MTEVVRTAGLMADMVAERLGRDPGDFEIQVATGAVMGGLLAAMIPMVQDLPGADFISAMDRAIDVLERGIRF